MAYFNFLKNIAMRFKFKDIQKPLGRWNIDYCNKAINTKVTLTNEDHCGSCGSTAVQKRLSKQEIDKLNRFKMQKWTSTVNGNKKV